MLNPLAKPSQFLFLIVIMATDELANLLHTNDCAKFSIANDKGYTELTVLVRKESYLGHDEKDVFIRITDLNKRMKLLQSRPLCLVRSLQKI